VTSVLGVVLDLVLGVVLTAWVVRFDMRRLPPERFARSWNDASFWSAVVAFGPLSIPVHFTRTRRSVLGLLVGLLWTAGVLVVLELLGRVVMWIAGDRY
jgi:hypothetical protein